MDGGMALPNPHKLPGEVFSPITLQQSTKEAMEKFLSSLAALFLLAGFLNAVLTGEAPTGEAPTEGYSPCTSTTTSTSTNTTTGPAIVQDPHTTAPTGPASTATSGGKQSHRRGGNGGEKGREEKDKSREDNKLGRVAESRCWLNLIVGVNYSHQCVGTLLAPAIAM